MKKKSWQFSWWSCKCFLKLNFTKAGHLVFIFFTWSALGSLSQESKSLFVCPSICSSVHLFVHLFVSKTLNSFKASSFIIHSLFIPITKVGFIFSYSPNPPFQVRVNTCRMSSHLPNLHILHDYFFLDCSFQKVFGTCKTCWNIYRYKVTFPCSNKV